MAAREAFLATMGRLLELQGYHATGLNQIVAESGAPKGSLYYYFPEGKEALTAEVIARTGATIAARIRQHLAAVGDAPKAVHAFLLGIARAVEATDCRGGGPIATVALETSASSDALRAACDAAYSAWREEFAAKLREGGYEPDRAERLATLIVAAVEGAVILCRTQRSAAPMEQVAEEIFELLVLARSM